MIVKILRAKKKQFGTNMHVSKIQVNEIVMSRKKAAEENESTLTSDHRKKHKMNRKKSVPLNELLLSARDRPLQAREPKSTTMNAREKSRKQTNRKGKLIPDKNRARKNCVCACVYICICCVLSAINHIAKKAYNNNKR